MKPIKLVDLGVETIRQDLLVRLSSLLDKGDFILGEEVALFEQELSHLIGVPHVIACNSGTDALVLSLLALGIRPGDEVITSPFSFFASASCIARVGATPIFSDIDPITYNLDPQDVERKITSRTRAILPVHLYGHPADMRTLTSIAGAHDLLIIEDCCQALLAAQHGQPVGTFGDAAAVSFFPTKNLGAFGDAGAVLTNDPRVADTARRLRVHGMTAPYLHADVGLNSRMDGFQAAVLRLKLPHLRQWTEQRRANADLYRTLLADSELGLPQEADGAYHTYHQFTVRTPRRDELQHHLAQHGIESRVYYPVPLNRQPALRSGQVCQNAEESAGQVLSLPVNPSLTPADIEQVARVIKER